MVVTLVVLAVIAAFALSGWILAELELRDLDADNTELELLLAEARRDRDCAEAFVAGDTVAAVDARPTLYVVDGEHA